MQNLLIDTDPGMDDAIAIAVALKSPEFAVRAITAVTGNLPADRTVENALKVLDLLRAGPLAVARGALEPRSGDYPSDPFSHGADGLAEAGFPRSSRPIDARSAAELIVATADEFAGDLTICALGPMTNLADALDLDPELPEKVTSLVAIGGAYGTSPYAWTQATGDNPVSEWNMFVDPAAAERIFTAGFRIVAVGLDVATQPGVNFTADELNRLRRSETAEAAFAVRVAEFVERRGYQSYCSLIDSLAVVAAARPAYVTAQQLPVQIEVAGTVTRGMTVVERRAHHARHDLPLIDVAVDVDFDAFRTFVVDALTR